MSEPERQAHRQGIRANPSPLMPEIAGCRAQVAGSVLISGNMVGISSRRAVFLRPDCSKSSSFDSCPARSSDSREFLPAVRFFLGQPLSCNPRLVEDVHCHSNAESGGIEYRPAALRPTAPGNLSREVPGPRPKNSEDFSGSICSRSGPQVPDVSQLG